MGVHQSMLKARLLGLQMYNPRTLAISKHNTIATNGNRFQQTYKHASSYNQTKTARLITTVHSLVRHLKKAHNEQTANKTAKTNNTNQTVQSIVSSKLRCAQPLLDNCLKLATRNSSLTNELARPCHGMSYVHIVLSDELEQRPRQGRNPKKNASPPKQQIHLVIYLSLFTTTNVDDAVTRQSEKPSKPTSRRSQPRLALQLPPTACASSSGPRARFLASPSSGASAPHLATVLDPRPDLRRKVSGGFPRPSGSHGKVRRRVSREPEPWTPPCERGRRGWYQKKRWKP